MIRKGVTTKEETSGIGRVEIMEEKPKRPLQSHTQFLDFPSDHFILHTLGPSLSLISTSPQGTGVKRDCCLPFH